MKTIRPEQFVEAWNRSNETLASLFEDEKDKKDCFVPLVRADAASLAPFGIPGKDKAFLIEAGLPQTFSHLAMHFDTLARDVARITELRPEEINNGVELPAMRYQLFLKIGRANEWSDCDYCVEEFSGQVYKLTYGRDTFQTVGVHEYGGRRLIFTDYPVLDANNWSETGPYFVSSSVA